MSLNMPEKIRVLLAGGGTGGHIYPGVALAKEFMKREGVVCLMVVTSKQGDEDIMKNEGIPYERLPVRGMNWSWNKTMLIDVSRLLKSFVHAWHIISAYKPDIIIGLGAYVSFPVLAIGKIKGMTTFIQEQNLLPGKANRVLGQWVDGVFTSFKETERYFPSQRVRMLGNPIRLVPSDISKANGRGGLGLKADLFTLLVFGGSRGAHAINLNAMDAFKIMKYEGIPFQVIHQTGKDDFNDIVDFYRKEAIISVVRPYFHQMLQLYPIADLVISRSGAGTISELNATGRPAILIPYPHAKADHQRVNALGMVKAGAARMIDESSLTGEDLAKEIMDLFKNALSLRKMAKASSQLGKPHAAKAICDQAILWFEEKEKRKYAS
jgi:UDP-N-acetylglucosamine--N-acetylmuramyl-(pentapeptide) pyrophosphoryl-undecaprenol N-acetylglucosamine transferase